MFWSAARRITICAALLVILLGIWCHASQGKQTLTRTMKTEFFTVHYDPSDPYLPQLMSETAKIALLRVSRELGYTPDKTRPLTLNIYRTHISFIEAGGLQQSKFTVGTASSGSEVISVDASGVFAPANETIAHEVTHAVIFRILGANVSDLPLWVNEGIAQYESEEFPDADNSVVAEAAADVRLIPLDDLSKAFPENNTHLAYAESASAIRYMVKHHGKSSLKALLHEMAIGNSFDRAMIKSTRRSGERFAQDWESSVSRNYATLKFTRIAMGTIPIIMAILAIIAYFVRRKQKIEAARQWEQEEFEKTLRRQLGNDWWR
ncbi:MAG: peptidase MA family metallohydrolase [Armatimonadota bacterium]|nr:hypothetical protein [bacterium]